jgi:catechol 2,3-dioxygenase-like lactoylglutathione lyase family enzyme
MLFIACVPGKHGQPAMPGGRLLQRRSAMNTRRQQPATRGVDHLAMVTDDMPPYDNLRHYFFDIGNDSLFAIFEYPKGLPRQNRDHIGGMQHVHVTPDRFDVLIERVRACGVNIIGPVPLGGRFLSAYVFDPFGIRLEFATDRIGVQRSVVESVLQTESEARAELETLFPDTRDVERWLSRMPLRKGETEHA